jgi:hypothetical protein
VGHLIDHSCCPLHTNAELAVRWTSDAKELAVVIVVAKRPILAGEWVWVNYALNSAALVPWTEEKELERRAVAGTMLPLAAAP